VLIKRGYFKNKTGRLRVDKENPNFLPLVSDVEESIGEEIKFMGDFLAGDERVNEMPALAAMHTCKFSNTFYNGQFEFKFSQS